MLVLVAGNNYLILFVGWEGKHLALNELFDLSYPRLCFSIFNTRLFHIHAKISSVKRIGPHSFTIFQVLIGSLLGDCHLEKRGGAIRAKFEQTNANVEYLMWFH
jgi:hypothetical protein